MVRKKIDPRIKALIEHSVSNGHRSLFVVIGDKGRNQIVNLHYMLSKAQISARPSVLWCYKKELGFSSNKKKRIRMLEGRKKKGLSLSDLADEDNLFDRFLSTTEIRYCYYKESEKILGMTFGMCILQDFEALTPNLLARTIETVKGGGMIVILLNNVTSLRQLYTMTMDIHARYRTEGTLSEDVVGRFNERFLLSLSKCDGSLFVDDELTVLPISTFSRTFLSKIENDQKDKDAMQFQEKQTAEIKEFIANHPPEDQAIAKMCKTLDQAKATLAISEALSTKTLRMTLSLTASRGRGKSASLGLAISLAIFNGFSNIFVTSPCPTNLGTLFAFVFKGLEALGYSEHTDYDAIQSTAPELSGCIIRVNVFKSHRQTIQYISPEDARILGQAELVVIDEAAAIPLPLVKTLIGSQSQQHITLLSSTIHGYEGTGRSLSLKLIQQLREHQGGPSGRSLRELRLDAPIRYAYGDPIELWLNKLLCFDAVDRPKRSKIACPHPKDCQLYYVNRDTLFSFHEASESFLQQMMYLYISSHYKNTPNDLQLMSDAPAHHLFVLLGPLKEDEDEELPEILAVIQVCIEGMLSKASILKAISRGQRGGGDLIPWTLSTQFQDTEFSSLSGARIVRIATSPDLQRMGYGTRAMQLLEEYYCGKMLSENVPQITSNTTTVKRSQEVDELTTLEPRFDLPPLLSRLDERIAEKLDWIGVSFGVTQGLAKFWKRLDFLPVYLRQTKNDLTGEHTAIMLKGFGDNGWLTLFFEDFYKRFYNLLPMSFRDMPVGLALELMYPSSTAASEALKHKDKEHAEGANGEILTKFDIRRLEAYLSNITDFHVILDLIPTIARSYFLGRLVPTDALTPVQSALLLSIGGQMKTIDELERTLCLPVSQLLAMLTKTLKKFFQRFRDKEETQIRQSLVPSASKGRPLDDAAAWDPTVQSLDEDLAKAALKADETFRAKQQELINALDLSKYSIEATEEELDLAVKSSKNPAALIQTARSTCNLEKQQGLFKKLQKRAISEKERNISKGITKAR